MTPTTLGRIKYYNLHEAAAELTRRGLRTRRGNPIDQPTLSREVARGELTVTKMGTAKNAPALITERELDRYGEARKKRKSVAK